MISRNRATFSSAGSARPSCATPHLKSKSNFSRRWCSSRSSLSHECLVPPLPHLPPPTTLLRKRGQPRRRSHRPPLSSSAAAAATAHIPVASRNTSSCSIAAGTAGVGVVLEAAAAVVVIVAVVLAVSRQLTSQSKHKHTKTHTHARIHRTDRHTIAYCSRAKSERCGGKQQSQPRIKSGSENMFIPHQRNHTCTQAQERKPENTKRE